MLKFLIIGGDGGRSIGGQDFDIKNSRVAGGELVYARTRSGSGRGQPLASYNAFDSKAAKVLKRLWMLLIERSFEIGGRFRVALPVEDFHGISGFVLEKRS